jgi:hypothetical protein
MQNLALLRMELHLPFIFPLLQTIQIFLEAVNIHQKLNWNTHIQQMENMVVSSGIPHTTQNINRLEMVQRRSARFVMGDYHTTSSVTTMLTNLDWNTL